MALTPQNTQNAFVQAYSAVFQGDYPKFCVKGLMATSTGSYVYTSGSIVAQYTSGPNAGKYVNYNSSGSNGQAVPIGVIVDDYFVNGTAPSDLINIAIASTVQFYQDQLSTQVSGDVAAAITAWGAFTTQDASGRNIITCK